jgi:hypothetical protein
VAGAAQSCAAGERPLAEEIARLTRAFARRRSARIGTAGLDLARLRGSDGASGSMQDEFPRLRPRRRGMSSVRHDDREEPCRRSWHVVLPSVPAVRRMTYEELLEVRMGRRCDRRTRPHRLARACVRRDGGSRTGTIRLVVRDDALDEYRTRFGTPHGSRTEW